MEEGFCLRLRLRVRIFRCRWAGLVTARGVSTVQSNVVSPWVCRWMKNGLEIGSLCWNVRADVADAAEDGVYRWCGRTVLQ